MSTRFCCAPAARSRRTRAPLAGDAGERGVVFLRSVFEWRADSGRSCGAPGARPSRTRATLARGRGRPLR
eukprot:4083937-Pyramimonas_sp.AAC.1